MCTHAHAIQPSVRHSIHSGAQPRPDRRHSFNMSLEAARPPVPARVFVCHSACEASKQASERSGTPNMEINAHASCHSPVHETTPAGAPERAPRTTYMFASVCVCVGVCVHFIFQCQKFGFAHRRNFARPSSERARILAYIPHKYTREGKPKPTFLRATCANSTHTHSTYTHKQHTYIHVCITSV